MATEVTDPGLLAQLNGPQEVTDPGLLAQLNGPARVGWAEENLAGPSELIGNTIANIPHAAAHAAVDLYRRVTGGDTSAPDPGAVQALEPTQYLPSAASAGGQQLAGDIKSMLFPPENPSSVDSQIQGIRDKALGPQNATVGDVLHQAGQVVGDVGALAPVVGGAVKGAGSLLDVLTPEEATAVTSAAQAAANKVAASGNAGAAGAAVDTSKLTAETQAELARIDSSNGTVNPTALSRVSDAESLPVPVKLTAGQARGDSGMVSEEFNLKGEDNNAIGNRYDEQDQALRDNLATMHRDAAPDTVANNNIQNGQAMVDSLKRYDEPKVAAINAAYQAAKDANGGNLQMDGSGFASAAEDALKPQGRARSLPAAAQGIIDDVKASGGQMSLDDFEGYRTTLANEVRKAQQAGDGNAVAAIGKVRDALENVQPIGASAPAKALYDNARNMARARFAELDADPAYKAAVEDDTPVGQQSDLADKFTDKYVMGGSQAALQRLRPKLDAEGSQAMTSATMNFLQNKAGINLDSGVGKFSNAGYNSGVAKVMPRAKELLGDQDLVDNVRKLGNVSNYVQGISRGGYANTSHTFVAAAKEMLGKAADIGEHGLNVAAHGLPLGTVIRKFSAGRSRVAAAREALKAGAGLED
jgi:hypothetical protein